MMGKRGIGGLDTGRERGWPYKKDSNTYWWWGVQLKGTISYPQLHHPLTSRPNRQAVSSVRRVLHFRAGGSGFKPRPDQHSGSLNN